MSTEYGTRMVEERVSRRAVCDGCGDKGPESPYINSPTSPEGWAVAHFHTDGGPGFSLDICAQCLRRLLALVPTLKDAPQP